MILSSSQPMNFLFSTYITTSPSIPTEGEINNIETMLFIVSETTSSIFISDKD
ncbi:hypothetical protein HBA_0428 [Sodalis endosymbiont of Henestaris halophilus]|nr:hypothetical protein HBA_0428 [Sodalis endosymbiont of Henestaris halophilus]